MCLLLLLLLLLLPLLLPLPLPLLRRGGGVCLVGLQNAGDDASLRAGLEERGDEVLDEGELDCGKFLRVPAIHEDGRGEVQSFFLFALGGREGEEGERERREGEEGGRDGRRGGRREKGEEGREEGRGEREEEGRTSSLFILLKSMPWILLASSTDTPNSMTPVTRKSMKVA